MFYGKEIIDQKGVDVNDAYIKDIDKYTGDNVVIKGCDSVTIMYKVKNRKHNHEGNAVGDEHQNYIFNTKIYEL